MFQLFQRPTCPLLRDSSELLTGEYLNSNHREVNRQYYPTEQLRQSNAIKKNDSTHKA